ncbi:threonine synthase [Paramicrobacterium agarici]|uniref:Threonine synthase n=1 Tax=Paramicrobacterium agarici TaxID=630514 RepID=A0A2A9DTM9_9MICO|nr:threonine synthase [Microbacterium agarici]PFG29505.1 L-threonine synthase [Microbacterium agarici]
MQYISTRGGTIGHYSDILVEGLAPNGGLAVPERMPQIGGDLERWRSLSYSELATEVIGLFATEIPRDDLARLCRAAYDPAKYASDRAVPLTDIGDGMTLVGLSEGPTLAFKDMAMQFLGEALEYVLATLGDVLNVLGATSGDTGSAAEHALRGRDRISVFMLSPQGRMSPFQRAQMYSLHDDNIHNIAVEGVFDDCQHLVKSLAEDLAFKREHHIGAVNSINFGRISAQIVYYVWAWLRVTDDVPAEKRDGFEVSFAVPSGNFGNILSGLYARLMGLPVRKLVLATNENNVLDEFFRTGRYRPRSAADTLATSSPSMDVSRASNLERFVFDLLGRDPERTAAAWAALAAEGEFDLSSEQERFADEFGIVSGTSSHQDRLDTIRAFAKSNGVVLDPHTADGAKVARDHVEPGVPMLVLETAKPEKFSDTISEALGSPVEPDAETQALLDAPQRVTKLPNDERRLRDLIEELALR